MPGPNRVAEKPATEAMPGDSSLPSHELMQAGSCDVDVAHEHELGDLTETGTVHFLVFYVNLQNVTLFRDLGAMCLHVDG